LYRRVWKIFTWRDYSMFSMSETIGKWLRVWITEFIQWTYSHTTTSHEIQTKESQRFQIMVNINNF
jgi:hypothetical protein